jgi:hypothetical protein
VHSLVVSFGVYFLGWSSLCLTSWGCSRWSCLWLTSLGCSPRWSSLCLTSWGCSPRWSSCG